MYIYIYIHTYVNMYKHSEKVPITILWKSFHVNNTQLYFVFNDIIVCHYLLYHVIGVQSYMMSSDLRINS